MNRDHFAHTFGFEDYNRMLRNSSIVYEKNDAFWYVTKLPQGKFLAWDSSEIADDRVEVFFTRQEAESYLNKLKEMQ